jgi:hypothetical protein
MCDGGHLPRNSFASPRTWVAMAALLAAACSSSSSPPADALGGGNLVDASGDSGNAAGAGGLGAGGVGVQGGASGTGGVGGSAGNAGVDAGPDAAGGQGGVGDGSVGGDAAAAMLRDPLPGPTMPDQPATLIEMKYLAETNDGSGYFLQTAGDSSGNVYLLGTGRTHGQPGTDTPFISKYGPDLARQWVYVPPTGVTPFTMTVGAAGELAFGGATNVALPGETKMPGNSSDAFAGKLDSAGKIQWAHQWGTIAEDRSTVLSFGPSGSVLAAGKADGQLPGSPAATASGPFAVRFEADGTRTWLKQYPSLATAALLVDASGALYIGGSGGSGIGGLMLRRLSPTGDLLSDTKIAVINSFGGQNMIGPGSLAGFGRGVFFASDQSAFFTFDGSILARMALAGPVDWYRKTGPEQMATIDSVEGVIWNGQFVVGNGSLAVTSDSLFVAGLYRNDYRNGSMPRPQRMTGYVARCDLDGKQLWFRQFQIPWMFDEKVAFQGTVLGLSGDSAGNVIVVSAPLGRAYVIKLAKADGTLM